MAKNVKKRAIVYSNVKENAQRAEEITKIKAQQINLDDEIIIGMSNGSKVEKKSENNKKNKKRKGKSKKKSATNSKKVQSKPTAQKRKMNPVKKKKILLIVKLIIIIVILVAGLIAFLKSSVFNIKKVTIKIENNNVLTETEIKELSSISIGENMYSINKKEIIEKIKTNSYVESVKIKRSLPDTIEIQIEERTLKYQLKSNGNYIYVDCQGYILETNTVKSNQIIITGFSTEDLSDGNRLNDDDLESLNNVNSILQEAESNEIKDYITSIDISDNDDYTIYFDGLGKSAHLGDMTSITEKMAYVKKILEVESDYEGEIFVNVDLNNGEYPYFREKV